MAETRGPKLQEKPSWTDLGDGIYNLSTPPVGFQEYLVLGTEKALLIDTGMGVGSLKPTLETLTSLPITVINTHGHPDHAGGDAEFDPPLMCPSDFDVYEKMATREFRVQDISGMPNGREFVPMLQPDGPAPVAVADGEEIDLGGRILQVIYTPGHTHGSICLFDRQTGTLFSGDTVQTRVALCEWNSSSVETFRDSLLGLKKLPVKKILCGHQPNIHGPELLDQVLACAQAILNGEPCKTVISRDGKPSQCCEMNGVSVSFTVALS